MRSRIVRFSDVAPIFRRIVARHVHVRHPEKSVVRVVSVSVSLCVCVCVSLLYLCVHAVCACVKEGTQVRLYFTYFSSTAPIRSNAVLSSPSGLEVCVVVIVVVVFRLFSRVIGVIY